MTPNPDMVPDFVCIGAQKAGTTWLYKQLLRHPAVAIPRKECNILRSPDAAEEYARFYAGVAADRLKGDVSPVYSIDRIAAATAARLCPDCRLVMLVRDPVRRAFSQYCMATEAGRIDPAIPFREAFDENLQYMQRRGAYAEILGEYAEAFAPREAMLILPFDRISRDPRSLLGQVFAFLGLDPDFSDDSAGRVFAPATRGRVIDPVDEDHLRAWYRPHNRKLRSWLTWDASWL